MSALAKRLACLKRQAGASGDGRAATPEAAIGGAPRPAPAELVAQLRRQLGLRDRVAAHAVRRRHADRALPGLEIGPGLYLHETHCDWLVAPAWLDLGFAGQGAIRRERFLHFDSETTGLAGGTGTRAFMIGAADWSADGLRLRQLITTTLAAEADMLRAFAAWLAPDTVLVSYNGRSYDAPLLATRYRLARLDNPLEGLPHLDLLHPVRRRWREDWPNCRLVTAEGRLLGVEREDDLPGAQAPRAWLDYLRGGSAADLRRVLEHNAQDLRSLAGILLRLGSS